MVPYFAKWRPKLKKVFPNNNLYLNILYLLSLPRSEENHTLCF